TSGKKKKKKNQTDTENAALGPPAASTDAAANEANLEENTADQLEPKVSTDNPTPPEEMQNVRKGHGRIGHFAYKTAENVFVPLEGYSAGKACPAQCGGRLYSVRSFGNIVIRLTCNPLASVTCYHLEKLRCRLCDW